MFRELFFLSLEDPEALEHGLWVSVLRGGSKTPLWMKEQRVEDKGISASGPSFVVTCLHCCHLQAPAWETHRCPPHGGRCLHPVGRLCEASEAWQRPCRGARQWTFPGEHPQAVFTPLDALPFPQRSLLCVLGESVYLSGL